MLKYDVKKRHDEITVVQTVDTEVSCWPGLWALTSSCNTCWFHSREDFYVFYRRAAQFIGLMQRRETHGKGAISRWRQTNKIQPFFFLFEQKTIPSGSLYWGAYIWTARRTQSRPRLKGTVGVTMTTLSSLCQLCGPDTYFRFPLRWRYERPRPSQAFFVSAGGCGIWVLS